jgi:hypothetical protein
MVELMQKNSCTPRDHICGHKSSCTKVFILHASTIFNE